MNLISVVSSSIKNSLRLIKLIRYGAEDVQEVNECMPFGLDSSPIKDTLGVYSSTSSRGQSVIIGYINSSQIADPGEFRAYSTSESGEVSTYIYLKNNSEIHIGGDQGNMVRFQELEQGFNELKSDFNSLTSKFNSHTHNYVTSAGAAVPTLPVSSPQSPSAASISSSKIDSIKTI